MIQILAVTVAAFLGIAAIGFLAARLAIVGGDAVAALRFFLFYFALPALVFQLVSTTPLTGINVLAFAVTATFATYCAFAIAFSIAALLNRGHIPESTVEGLLGANAEVALLGAALAIGAFGAAGAAPMALILAVDGAMLAAITPLMMALDRNGRSEPAALARDIARRVFLNPLLIATVAGFTAAALGLRAPAAFDGLLTLLRQAAIPVALLALGASLPFRTVTALGLEVPALLAVKLIGHPLIVYLLLTWVGGFDRVWIGTAVLMAALPPTAGVLALAKDYGIPSDRIAASVFLATAVSVVTLALALGLVTGGVLPDSPFR